MDKRVGHAVGDAVRVLQKNRKILDDLLMTEGLRTALIQNRVFTTNTIEELFLVTAKATWVLQSLPVPSLGRL